MLRLWHSLRKSWPEQVLEIVRNFQEVRVSLTKCLKFDFLVELKFGGRFHELQIKSTRRSSSGGVCFRSSDFHWLQRIRTKLHRHRHRCWQGYFRPDIKRPCGRWGICGRLVCCYFGKHEYGFSQPARERFRL